MKASSRLSQTIPAMPVRAVPAAVDFYRDRLGFAVIHHDGGFAVMARDEAVVHLWESSDESWRDRDTLERPVRSSAESCIAGTASCRILVEGVDELYKDMLRSDVLHPRDPGGPVDTDFGTRELATLDLDGNLITFFEDVE